MTFSDGFGHFDGNHRETFTAALILFCLDEDQAFLGVFSSLVCKTIGLPSGALLRDWGREASLDTGTERARRSDLWLRFDDAIILVEIKTHSAWNAASVKDQVQDQLNSRLEGAPVSSVLLLAPGALLRTMTKLQVPKLPWADLLRAAASIPNPTRTLELAREHWSRTVERDFALSGPTAPFAQLAAQTACFVTLLRSAFLRLGGEPKGDAVWFSSPDGQPSRKHGWAWIGMSVPGTLPNVGRAYIGIYTYTQAPSEQALGVFIEAYRSSQHDEPLASAPFPQGDLSTDQLHAALEHFVATYQLTTAPRGGSPTQA